MPGRRHLPFFDRRSFLLAGACAPALRALAPELLQPYYEKSALRIAAPGVHFLQGKLLEQLRSGSSLVMSLQLSVSIDGFQTIHRRSFSRFVYSFDIWEEQFAIAQLGTGGNTISHLLATQAEVWPFRQAAIDVSQVDRAQPLWLRMELRVDEAKAQEPAMLDPSATLTRLIEWFAKPQRGEPQRWTLQKGPFQLANLPNKTI